MRFVAAVALLCGAVWGYENPIDIEKRGEWSIFPFFFSSDATGIAGGFGTVTQGLLQPQTTLVTSLFAGEPQTIETLGGDKEEFFHGGFFAFDDLKIPFSNRLYFSVMGADVSWPTSSYYIDGTHDSDRNDRIVSAGRDIFLYMKLGYVLPLGEGVDNSDGLYSIKGGFAQNREGYGGGLPFVTGRSMVGIKSLYQYREIEDYTAYGPWSTLSSQPLRESQGLRLFLSHNNTDFDMNPSRGYSFDLEYTFDIQNDAKWDYLKWKYSHYIPMPTLPHTVSDTLALNLWTAYSLEWADDRLSPEEIAAGRPPLGEGATLGGIFRMRGYESNRFSDRAALYMSAEYRAILENNPLKGSFVEKYLPVHIEWFELAGFVETGRVHSSYDTELLNDMKVDYGISLRAMTSDLPVRFDIAKGDEGTNMWVMIRHPFDF